ncbi:MAG: cytochrome ubiquinol oxidase subunit [Mycobacterium sp.]|jgi:cytochrome d ubiquinol oxidase subunit I|nr:cytochrome ubiquinol oxidase subunit [Mycobacterium sp.]
MALSHALLDAAGAPAGLLPARQQMAVSLGFHIVLASFGLAFPALIFVLHWRGAFRGDSIAFGMARRWAKVAAVLFAIGAVSGTVLSFEMGLLWPGLMGRFGDVIGLPFGLEGIGFFLEAIFLGLYLYGWDRLPPRRHLLMLIPMLIAGVYGPFCVISANAWMNRPAGFRIVNGAVTDVNPWRAMFNGRVWLELLHMWIAAYMVVGFMVCAVYAGGMLRGRTDDHHRLGFSVAWRFAAVATLAQPVVGHIFGTRLIDDQVPKLVAIELDPTTERPAPLRIGGLLIDGQVRWALPIPRLGSIVTQDSWDKPVPGLDTVPPGDRPPINITHVAFQTMVGVALLLAASVIVYWVARRRHHDLLADRWFLRFMVIAGPLAILALECGWTTTEVGRQPWTVWHVLRTADAASMNPGLWWTYLGILVIYSGMSVGAYLVLTSMARRWRAGKPVTSPYGPALSEELSEDEPVAAGSEGRPQR